ncbi:Gametocyte-specific factor 1 [Nymphon striatum]|nr:Gametocyte-specific factor 1 [Nymphon striatum]
MSSTRDSDENIQCPYEPSHLVSKLRMEVHLRKCARSHPKIKLKTCPFNVLHRVKSDLDAHILECVDRHSVVHQLIDSQQESDKKVANTFALSSFHKDITEEENWENEILAVPIKHHSIDHGPSNLPFACTDDLIGKSRRERREYRDLLHQQKSDMKRNDPIKSPTVLPKQNPVQGNSKSITIKKGGGATHNAKTKSEEQFQVVKSKKNKSNSRNIADNQIKMAPSSNINKTKKGLKKKDKCKQPKADEEEDIEPAEPIELDPVKLERKIRKKLAQIENLKQLNAAGTDLTKVEICLIVIFNMATYNTARLFDKKVVCPYDNAHVLTVVSLSKHLIKCAKRHPDIILERCPFNATHRVKASEFAQHLLECEDRDVVDKQLVHRNRTDKTRGNLTVPAYDIQPTLDDDQDEAWDNDTNVPTMTRFNQYEGGNSKFMDVNSYILSSKKERLKLYKKLLPNDENVEEENKEVKKETIEPVIKPSTAKDPNLPKEIRRPNKEGVADMINKEYTGLGRGLRRCAATFPGITDMDTSSTLRSTKPCKLFNVFHTYVSLAEIKSIARYAVLVENHLSGKQKSRNWKKLAIFEIELYHLTAKQPWALADFSSHCLQYLKFPFNQAHSCFKLKSAMDLHKTFGAPPGFEEHVFFLEQSDENKHSAIQLPLAEGQVDISSSKQTVSDRLENQLADLE